jgi:predicted phosphodiesterase
VTPIKKWKKWMAVSCSHGDFIDPEARDAVLKFRQDFKPDTILHLGDFIDAAACRSGAMTDPNAKDRAASVAEDLAAGVDFLNELRPNHILYGNHEARLFKLAGGPNALASHAATLVINEIEKTAKQLKARLYPYDIRSFVEIGGVKFLHGYMYNVQAIRDHAETYGRCVIGHLHRVGQERARTIVGASGYCVGMLASFSMEYAATRRATLAWSQGFAYGYYTDKSMTVNLCERLKENPWILP